MAGKWAFNPTTTSSAIVDMYSTIHIGTSKSQGIVLGGWAVPSASKASPQQVTIAILDQNADGTLKLNTSKYIGDATTNGIGSVIVTDFNEDGVDDIFLASYNERPLTPEPTIVYLSNGIDSFTKSVLPDSTLSHSAILTEFNGQKTVVTAGYGLSDPYYQYDPATKSMSLNLWGNTYLNGGLIYASSATLGDFNNDGKTEIVRVDHGGDFTSISRSKISSLDGNNLGVDLASLGSGYFNNNPNYPGRYTHMYRVWTEDFNYDGKLDLIVGESTGVADWSNTTEINASKLVLLQNQGNYVFIDKTDLLGSAYATTTNNVDYSTQRVDLDDSGINSYLLGDSALGAGTTQSNYLLVNDGTGKLYAALHDEFIGWGKLVQKFITQNNYTYNPGLFPKFRAYQLSNGNVNYLVDCGTGDGLTIPLINVPVQYNITTDFTKNVTIADRNNSMLIRAWAGNDAIYDLNRSQSATHIDGGLGADKCIYSDLSTNYTITKTSTGYTVQDTAGLYGADTLVNIEKLQFTDQTISIAPPIEGGGTKDKLTGTTDNDEIYGYAGNDTLTGLAGNDTLDGGTGDDSITGGAGNDTYIADSIKDKIIEKTNEGTDTVITTVTYTLANNVENLTLSGTSAINGTGNTASNIVAGNDAANSINGSLGSDTLTGGNGNDTFVFNSKLGSTNIDTITDFSTGIDKIAIDDAIFTKLKGDKDLSDNLYIQSIPGTSTQDTNDYLFYDFESGRLYYDADGSGTKSIAVVIAIIGSATEIAATDFVII